MADGRYLARREADGGESVLVLRTLAAPPRHGRRRRRPRDAEAAPVPPQIPVTRATAVRAVEPFAEAAEAAGWLTAATASEAEVDAVVADGIALLNDALHAQALAAADPHATTIAPERAVAVRIGYGTGEATAEGAFSEAREVDVHTATSRRRRREEDLRPQERVSALLRGRESAAACELLLLRSRADLDAGRRREAALQLRIALEALQAELPESSDDPDHNRDVQSLTEQSPAVEAAADRALSSDLPPEAEATTRAALETAERILRRRRVLDL